MKFSEEINNGITVIRMIPETPQEIEHQQKLNDWWNKNGCQCENVGNNVKYINDNTPGACTTKHHWIHKTCGKVVQVG